MDWNEKTNKQIKILHYALVEWNVNFFENYTKKNVSFLTFNFLSTNFK